MKLPTLAGIIVLAGNSVANAQVISQADLIAEFTCRDAKCTTTCHGIGDTTFEIHAKLLWVYNYVKQPLRVWIKADNKIYVLGEDVSCEFGGDATLFFVPREPIPGTPTPQLPPQCICVGTVCDPPGCNEK